MTAITALLLASVVATAFVSGVLSLAGGTVLMGVFGWVLPVSVAMILHGVTQTASNGSRCILYWRHIHWPILGSYLVGAAVCIAIFSWLAYVPNKIVLFLLLGTMPFVNFILPRGMVLDITKRGAAPVCGFVVTACLLTAGISGPILDVFYVRGPLTRHQIHATKGVTQTIGHFTKVLYFLTVIQLSDQEMAALPLWVYVAVVPLAYIGNRLARRFLDGMTDDQFKSWTQRTTMLIGVIFLSRAAVLVAENGL